MPLVKNPHFFFLSSWNFVKMIIERSSYFHQVSWGLEKNRGFFTNGKFLSVGSFFTQTLDCTWHSIKLILLSGWYHQVLNLTDTLSINHNWFNGTNIEYVWCQLEHELSRVKKEMSDCFEQNDEDWKEMCQKLLLARYCDDSCGI